MKQSKVYPTIWQPIPFSLDSMDYWYTNGHSIPDLTLVNDMALNRGVSEMILNVSKISVMDDGGKEHFMTNFNGNKALNLKGLHTGLYLKTKEGLNLQPGNYKTFRFYLNGNENYFFNKDRNMEAVYGFPFMDFNIQNGLVIQPGESKRVILRFDFEPFSLASYFKPFFNIFKRSKTITHKWANSMN